MGTPKNVLAHITALTHLRKRRDSVDAAYQRALREATQAARADGYSLRSLATDVGLSKSYMHRIAQESSDHAAPIEPQTSDWTRYRAGLSQELMDLHGIPLTRLYHGTPDTVAVEYLNLATGSRVLVYTQVRWHGADESDPETNRLREGEGIYLVEWCPALDSGKCAANHEPISLADLGAEPDLAHWMKDDYGHENGALERVMTVLDAKLGVAVPTTPDLVTQHRYPAQATATRRWVYDLDPTGADA